MDLLTVHLSKLFFCKVTAVPTSEYLLAKANFIHIWSLVGVNFTLRHEVTILSYLKNVQKQDVHMHTSTFVRWWLSCPTKANAVTRPTLKVSGKSLNLYFIFGSSLLLLSQNMPESPGVGGISLISSLERH